MHSQLLHVIHTREMEKSVCYNCGSSSRPEYDRSIFWKNYAFCSGWCQYDTESDIRTNVPTLQLADSTGSNFLEMFQRIEDEANEEMQNIRYLCSELIKRPTFTKEDRSEMARDYEALEKEMAMVA
jgi:hypothetical protein